MKTLKQIMLTSLARGLAVGALAFGLAQTSQAGSADPSAGGPIDGSFTWDLTSSGAGQRGLSLVTFSNDFTFHGYQMLAAIPPANASTNASSNPRGSGGDVGRGGSGGGRTTQNLLFGFSRIDGVWTIDSSGKIVGFFDQALNVTSLVTNFFAATNDFILVNIQNGDTTNVTQVFTNGQGSAAVSIFWPNPAPGFTQDYTLANTNFTTQVGTAESTNVVSFTGTAVLRKRLTLVCNTSFGKVTFRGVPVTTGADISGNWIGIKRQNGLAQNEFFSLTSFQFGNPFPSDFPDIADFPNLYFTTDGVGAGYTFSGVAMVSQQKKVGFTFMNEDGTMRSMIGTLKSARKGTTAKTEGIAEPLSQVNFTATLQ
jgi:hypothetical protein